MWKAIHSVLYTYVNLKFYVMTSFYLLFFEKPQVRHSILFNWALLVSRKPLQDHYRNPLFIGAMRINALEASGAILEQLLLVENALVEESNNRREVKSMLKKLNLNIK